MSWRDELRPASFRGVAFQAIDIAGEEGRRFVADETPQTDALAPTNDLGRRRPGFRVRGFVIGDDYLDQRDRLLAALNDFGPGELVHPWRGRMRVQVGGVSWSLGPGHGMCSFEWECVDAGGQPLEVVRPVYDAQASDQVQLASAAARASYTESGPLGMSFVDEAALFDRFVATLGGLATYLDSDTWNEATAALFEEALAEVDDARALLRYVRSTAALIWHSVGAASDALRLAQATEMADGMRVMSLVRVAEITIAETYTYADQAEQAMVAVAAELSDWMDDIEDQDLYVALLDLRTTLVDSLTAAASRLPRKTTHIVTIPTPALVVAYDLYGTRRLEQREREILELNAIGHPGFVHGPIEVLSR